MKINKKTAFLTPPLGILFDTDNTLYNYEPAHKAAMSSVARKCVDTFQISEPDFYEAFDEARKQVKLRLQNVAASHSRLLYTQ